MKDDLCLNSDRPGRRRGPERGPARERSGFVLLLLAALIGLGGCSDQVTDPPDGNGSDAYDHRLAPGASAGDLLSADDYDRLVVQIQYVEGFRPTDQGLQHLEDFLAARLNKPGGIDIQIDEPLQIEPQATYSAADVRSIEEEHRTTYTEGTTIAAYFLFLDGEYSEASNVLGIAYNNTSMALFAEKIGEHTGGITQPPTSKVEGTVASHEFGHILGLVNNGSEMQQPHQDTENGKHCDNPDCLMHYAVRTTDFIANLFEGEIPELDQNCLDDLVANGGK